MVVFIRLMTALLLARFRRSPGILGTAVIAMRCWPNDLDLNVHMNSGRYVSMMDVGRVELMARLRAFRPALRRGWRPIAGGSMIRYRRSLLPFQRFTVSTRILCWDVKWFYFEQKIERGGDLCASAYVRMLFRGPSGNIAPADVLALIGPPAPPSPPMPAAIVRWLEAESA
ncbi:MAG TPA: thioesterase family protein [Thermoanaerobaculia bacterium]|nr:thioesterase family protein [Thermoanaerobaculia bacterium]